MASRAATCQSMQSGVMDCFTTTCPELSLPELDEGSKGSQ